MTNPKKTWREKRLAKEENGSDVSSDEGEHREEASHKGEDGEDSAGLPGVAALDVNMVFIIPREFWAPENKVAELVVEAERVVFKKPENTGKHMRSLYIRGHLDGKPIGQMM
jgi:hypothetical protein